MDKHKWKDYYKAAFVKMDTFVKVVSGKQDYLCSVKKMQPGSYC